MPNEKALKLLWKDLLTVKVQTKTKNRGLTNTTETVKYTGIPCKLSFESTYGGAMTKGEPESVKAQRTMVICSKAYDIPAGSKLIVTRAGKDFTYASSGEARVYTYHQEIDLELWDKWA